MTPINFKQANRRLSKPDDMTDEECGSLEIHTDGTVCTSKWKLNEEEIAHIVHHGYIWISVHSGRAQPPILPRACILEFLEF